MKINHQHDYDGPSKGSMHSKPKRLTWAQVQEEQADIDKQLERRGRKATRRNRDNIR